MFHQTVGDAKYWGDALSISGAFKSFLLRKDGESGVEVYDENFHHYGDVARYDPTPYTRSPAEGKSLQPDRGSMLTEVRETLMNEDITILAHADLRVEGSAAERSNLWVMLRKMIGEGSPEDLKNMFLFETRKNGFRSLALCADLTRVSAELQDAFLDRIGHINKAWPLVHHHFKEAFGACLACERADYALDILKSCADYADLGPTSKAALVSKWAIASKGRRYQMSYHLADTLFSGITYAPEVTELFLESSIKEKGFLVVKDYKTFLAN